MERGKIKREFEYKEKKSNKKLIITLTVTIIVLFLLFFLLKNLVLTTKVIEKPYTPENCSNESIRKAWESIFKGGSENLIINGPPQYLLDERFLNLENLSDEDLQSESGLNIYVDISSDLLAIKNCPLYSVYQVNGTNIKAIMRLNSLSPILGMDILYVINGNFKQEAIENITSALKNSSEGLENYFSILMSSFDEENSTLLPRNISNIGQAKSEFESVFKIDSTNWTSDLLNPEYTNITVYTFNETENARNITLFGESIDPLGIIINEGIIIGNKSLDSYIYTYASAYGMLYEIEKKFENWTSPINTSIKNITVELNNSKLKISSEGIYIYPNEYPKIQKVKILENNQSIIETEINYTSNFDWTKIILKKQDINSTRGYIIINGLNFTKNITLDRLNNKSEAVCVKDSQINSINEISRGCNYTNEYLIRCLGNSSNNQTNITCRISGGKFFITGLTHSAVIEMLSSEENIEPCIQNWTCDDWTDYEEECGYRTCTDLNTCNDISTKPLEYKECPVCVPNWECTSFLPEKCPKSEKRIRTCEDLNNCGKDGEMPNTVQSCQRKNNWIWIAIEIGGGIILLLILIFFLGKKGDKPTEEEQMQPPKPQEEFYKENTSFPQKREQKDASNQTEDFKQQVKPNKIDDEEFYYPEED